MIQQHYILPGGIQFTKDLGKVEVSSPEDEIEIMEKILEWLKANEEIGIHAITVEESFDQETKHLLLIFSVFFEGEPINPKPPC